MVMINALYILGGTAVASKSWKEREVFISSLLFSFLFSLILYCFRSCWILFLHRVASHCMYVWVDISPWHMVATGSTAITTKKINLDILDTSLLLSIFLLALALALHIQTNIPSLLVLGFRLITLVYFILYQTKPSHIYTAFPFKKVIGLNSKQTVSGELP